MTVTTMINFNKTYMQRVYIVVRTFVSYRNMNTVSTNLFYRRVAKLSTYSMYRRVTILL